MALSFPSSPTTGQLYSPGPGLPTWQWDGTKWTAGAFVTPPPPPLATLPDVTLTNLAAGQLLTYTGTTWGNGGHAIIQGSTTAGSSNGLTINAGTTSNDGPILLRDVTGANTWFSITGQGSGQLGQNASRQLRWDTSGNFTLQCVTTGILVPDSPSGVCWSIAPLTGAAIMIAYNNGNVRFPAIATTGTTLQTLSVDTANANQLVRAGSAARFKKDIQPLSRNRAHATVKGLCAVTYHSAIETEDQERLNYGLIAEEVAAIDPALVCYDEEGKPLSVAYERVAMLLLPLVQELLGMDEPEEVSYG